MEWKLIQPGETKQVDMDLETFLGGMETHQLLQEEIEGAWCLETFLGGMETLPIVAHSLRQALPLKPSLVEWKPPTGPGWTFGNEAP